MENGSRALIMAATVLLGVFLLSMMIYMFRAGGNVTKQFDEKQSNLQLEYYNSQFELFDRHNNTITDVISLANLAYSTNEINEFSASASVLVEIDIEGKIYSIPNELKDATKIWDEERKFLPKRNTILKDGAPVDIYTLLNTSVKDLTGQSSIQKWDMEHGVEDGSVAVKDDELLTQTAFDSNGRRIYKYIFVSKGDNITYHEVSGRLNSIKLELYTNSEYPTT